MEPKDWRQRTHFLSIFKINEKIIYIFVLLFVPIETYALGLQPPLFSLGGWRNGLAGWRLIIQQQSTNEPLAPATMKVSRRIIVTDYKTNVNGTISVYQTRVSTNRVTLWTGTVVNAVIPYSCYVSKNGLYVVTLGNFQKNGSPDDSYDSDDEVVVYKEGKVLAQYSLDDLLGEGEHPFHHPYARSDWIAGGPAWLGGYPGFFSEDGTQFCLWVGNTVEKWVVIDLSNGSVVKMDKDFVVKIYEKKQDYWGRKNDTETNANEVTQ